MNDGKVELVMREVLKRLEEDDCGLTIRAVDDRSYTVTEEDVLRDLEIFADEVFDGDAEQTDGILRVKFRNGQTFCIDVKEEF